MTMPDDEARALIRRAAELIQTSVNLGGTGKSLVELEEAAMTPEGKVKMAVNAVLARYGEDVYWYMPVPGGYGRSALDYLGWACGLGFAIETKRPKGKLTPRQEVTIEQMKRAGARVFVIDGPDGLGELERWLTTVVTAKK